MEFKEAKNKFVQTWGALGSQWGINKTMAQIHALLMISHEAVSMEDIMEELQISRGNASMNLRALMDWGDHIVRIWSGGKVAVKGEWTGRVLRFAYNGVRGDNDVEVERQGS